jgi:hypothetical protein
MAVEFRTESQKKVYERVAGILKEQFGKQVVANESAPVFMIRSGSAVVQIAVLPISDRFTSIRTFSWVVTGAETTSDLSKFLLEENFNLAFGDFALEPGTGDILLKHVILGEGCDTDELMFSVGQIASAADEYDDKIVQRFGGQRAIDRG